MKTLELKHIAPYLPYELSYLNTLRNEVELLTIYAFANYTALFRANNYKPILRPLSYLTKEIEHNGEKFVPIKNLISVIIDKTLLKLQFIHIIENNNNLCIVYKNQHGYYYTLGLFFSKELTLTIQFDVSNSLKRKGKSFGVPYEIYEKLFEWHFDVFGFIEQGLAVDINTLKQ